MNEKEEKTKGLKARLGFLEGIVAKVEEQIKFERENTPEDTAVLEQRITIAKTENERLENEIQQKKAFAREAKDNITRLKEDHKTFSLHEGDAEENLNRLKLENWYRISDEIKQLGETITKSESDISALYISKKQVEQTILKCESTIDIVKRGFFSQSVEKDPRLIGLLDEINKVAAKLKSAEDSIE